MCVDVEHESDAYPYVVKVARPPALVLTAVESVATQGRRCKVVIEGSCSAPLSFRPVILENPVIAVLENNHRYIRRQRA